TTYMSSEELTAFETSINKGFVGIGVQYIDCDGTFIVTKIFNDSPAENAGVMAGDIITNVEGVSVEGMSSDDVVAIIQGEEGTPVVIGFTRGTELIDIEIIRGTVDSNTYGYMVDEDSAYVEILSFGDTTGSELEKLMINFKEQGADSLIIDLRDNGGGYLTSLVEVASLFLDKDEVAMIEEYSDGSSEIYMTTGGKIEGYDEIVIIVNGSSASASEVLTLALMEKLDNVTVVGSTTYGKGTVQTTQFFADGSAIKFTAGIWTSPNGVWIDGVGITPDIEVDIPTILSLWIPALTEGLVIQLDEVASGVLVAQEALDFLGYEITRKDGYFDETTMAALQAFADDIGYELVDGIDETIYNAMISETQKQWATDSSLDPQLQKAIEVIND
ncbi:MAG: S41 family peptidase, partial [Erysipelotrichaceae bacterium]